MQVESIAECSAILWACIKLPFVFALSIFEWPFTTGFTLLNICMLPV